MRHKIFFIFIVPAFIQRRYYSSECIRISWRRKAVLPYHFKNFIWRCSYSVITMPPKKRAPAEVTQEDAPTTSKKSKKPEKLEIQSEQVEKPAAKGRVAKKPKEDVEVVEKPAVKSRPTRKLKENVDVDAKPLPKKTKEINGTRAHQDKAEKLVKPKVIKGEDEEMLLEPVEKRGRRKAEPINKDESAPTTAAAKKKKAETEEAKPASKVKEKKLKATEKKEIKEKKEKGSKKVAKKKTKENEKEEESSEASENKNTVTTDWGNIEFDCKKKNPQGNLSNFKITSWNVAGLKAWMKKDGMSIFKYDAPNVLCLQETKCQDDKLPEEITNLEGYHKYWCAGDKSGYAGVGLLTREMPIEVLYGIGDEDQDKDGRCLTAEFKNFYLVSVYVPNAGRKLVTLDKRLEWNEAFKKFIKELDAKKPVIICGDMNVAHEEIDLANPKTNTKNAGFTIEEREGMSDFLGEGFIDTFRDLYPDQKDVYTFWTFMAKARSRNIGWRLDYFLVSELLKNQVCDSVIRDQIFGSDHCPITLFLHF